LRSSYLRALTWVTVAAAAVSGLAVAVGEPAVVVLLGEPWRGAGLAVMAMAGLGLGKAFTSVSEEALKGCGHTKKLNYLTATELVLGVGLLVLIIPFGLVGVGLAISLTAVAVGIQCLTLARPVVDVTVADLRRAILPPLVAAAVATALTVALERGVLHSDTHPVLVAVGLLLLDVLVYLVAYLGVISVLAPAIGADVWGAARGVLRGLRRR
jgi:PST family polysaccharide transporter